MKNCEDNIYIIDSVATLEAEKPVAIKKSRTEKRKEQRRKNREKRKAQKNA